jgi:hypothetical protein
MLIPLTRKTFESLIPAVGTGAQFVYCWGKLPNLLFRLLISVASASVVLIIGKTIGNSVELFLLLIGIVVGLYWLWRPVLVASLRNQQYRRFPYSGFWRGEVLDVYVTDELVGNEETVNDRGELVIVENRERCLNLEVGDETGFSTQLRVPIKRSHQAIDVGDVAEMVVLSKREDLARIDKTSDIYIVNRNIWVSDYPYLQREAFVEVSRQLRDRKPRRDQRNPTPPDSSPGGALARRSSQRRRGKN